VHSSWICHFVDTVIFSIRLIYVRACSRAQSAIIPGPGDWGTGEGEGEGKELIFDPTGKGVSREGP
jgi:hypothetical protein